MSESMNQPAGADAHNQVLAMAIACGGVVYRNRANAHQPAIAFGDEGWQRFAGAVAARQAQAETLRETIDDFEHVLTQWARAYPTAAFPEPDLAAAAAALEAAGMTLDSVSAAAMRHVATTLEELFAPIRQAVVTDKTATRCREPSPNAPTPAASNREQSMAMMIRMLCSHTANAGTRQRAMELLRRYGLQGSPLRTAAAAGDEQRS